MKYGILKSVVIIGVGILGFGMVPAHAQQYVWSNLVGNPGGAGFGDGAGSAARFNYPNSVAVDSGGTVYVADSVNNTIRKMVFSGTTCTVSTLAGTPGVSGTSDGTGSNAQFNCPSGIAVDSNGKVYVADSGNNTIRVIAVGGGVTTLAGNPGQFGNSDGTGAGALFGYPMGVAVDGGGNVYVADTYNNTIRKVTSGGVVTTLAGTANTMGSSDGPGSVALFNTPNGLAVDASGNVFVADTLNHTIRKITSLGVVTTLAGTALQYSYQDGTGSGAMFDSPGSVAVDGGGNVYVADTYNHTIRLVTQSGVVTTLSGSAGAIGYSDGTAGAARFNFPGGIAVDGNGNVYVADTCNHSIRKESWTVVSTVAGSASKPAIDPVNCGSYNYPYLVYPTGIAMDAGGNLYIASTWNHLILQCTPQGATSAIAGATLNPGTQDGSSYNARFNLPGGIAVDSGTNVYVADTHNSTIRKVSLAVSGTWATTTICGLGASQGSVDGSGTSAMFNNPIGIAVDSGTNLYVADTYNSTIRKVTCSGTIWTATTIAGSAGVTGPSDGTGSGALFAYPYGIAVDSGTNLYVADSGNYTIRMLTLSGSTWSSQTIAGSPGVSGTLDGTGGGAQFGYPTMLTLDSSGNLFVTDKGNSTVRMLTHSGSNWVVTTVAGTLGVSGGVTGLGGIGMQAQFSGPMGIVVKSGSTAGSDILYVMDTGNNRISMGAPVGTGTGSSITKNSATLTGVVDPNGLATTYYFQYGGINTGTMASTSGTFSAGSGTNFGTVSVNLTGLATNCGYNYRLVEVNASGTFYGVTQTLTTLPSVVPTISSATTITGTTSCPLTYTIVANNATTSFGTSPLPAGLGLNPLTGVISGIPTVAAATNVILSATNAMGTGTSSLNFNIVNLPLPVFTSPVSTSGIAGTAFSYTIGATNFTTSYSASGLPAGVTLNAFTGVISGVPTSVGTYAVTLGAINYTGTATQPLTFIVTPPYIWSNFVGNPGISGTVDGIGTNAQFYYPQGIAMDSGSNVYVVDTDNFTIRKITPSGSVSTLAGSPGTSGTADGTGTNAQFYYPQGVAVDSGSNVYVGDGYNCTIRMITPSGAVSTLAGSPGSIGSANGTGTNAQFYFPKGVAVDSGSNVYVADSYNYTIRKITPSGSVSTLAGTPRVSGTTDGIGAAARFYFPTGVAVDSGSNVYVADTYNQTIRKVTPTGVVTTIGGTLGKPGPMDGPGNIAQFNFPSGITVDSGTNLYIADNYNHTIRKMTLSGTIWMVTTIGGTAGFTGTADGIGSGARFYYPWGVCVDGSSNLYVADTDNFRIFKGSLLSQTPSITSALSVSGTDGVPFSYTITANKGGTNFVASGLPPGLTLNGATGVISGVITASGTSNVLLSASNAIGTGSTATAIFSIASLALPSVSSPGVASGGAGNTFSYTIGSTNYPTSYSAIGLPSGLSLNAATGVISGTLPTIGTYGVTIGATNVSGTTTTSLTISVGAPYFWNNFAGNPGVSGSTNGTGTSVKFNYPAAVAVDSGSNVYVADTGNQTIRMITPSGFVSTLAGTAGTTGTTDGQGVAALFRSPFGVAVDSGSNVYVADTFNSTIRKITISGSVSTLAGSSQVSGTANGTGTNAKFFMPYGVAVDSGSNVYVADTNNNTIRKITPSGSVSTLAGTVGTTGTTDGQGVSALFYSPYGVAVDSGSNVYVADTNNNTIRKITPSGFVSTLAGTPGITGASDGPGTVALFSNPTGVTVDSGTNIYVTDGDNIIRKVTLVSGTWMVTTLGGTPNVVGTSSGIGSVARFNNPQKIAVNGAGSLFVADYVNDRISVGTLLQSPVITSSTVITGTNFMALSYTITASNSPTSYSVTGLPSWLSLNTTTGVISGTPTMSGTFVASVGAGNLSGLGMAMWTLTVLPAGSAYQSWQSLVFTAPQLSHPTISGDTANPTGDGISNLMKYALGMNPNISYSGTSSQMPYRGVNTVGSNQYLTITFTGTATDVTYSVEVISDLTGTWTTLYSSVLGTAPGTMTVSDTVPMTSTTKRFMRLQVNH